MGPIPAGKNHTLFDGTISGAKTITVDFNLDAESCAAWLSVNTAAGDVDVTIRTLDGDQHLDVIVFPTQSAPTTSLIPRQAGSVTQRMRAIITTTDTANVRLTVRGLAAGEISAEVSISGASTGSNSAISVGSGSPTILIPAALTDRSGMLITNTHPTSLLYVGFSVAKTSSTEGTPVLPNYGRLAMDVGAGVTVYGISSSGSIDVRLMEAGG